VNGKGEPEGKQEPFAEVALEYRRNCPCRFCEKKTRHRPYGSTV